MSEGEGVPPHGDPTESLSASPATPAELEIVDGTGEWSSAELLDGQTSGVHRDRRIRLLPGLLVGLLGWGALFGYGASRTRAHIEASLTERSRNALEEAGFDDPVVSYSGRDASVVIASGSDVDAAAALVRTAGAVPDAPHYPGPRVVVVRTDPARVAAATTTLPAMTGSVDASFDGDSPVRFSGSVAAQEALDALLDGFAKQAPVAEAEHSVTIAASGLDARTATWVGRSIGELKRVGAVSAEVTGSAAGLNLRAAVPNLAVRDAVSAFAESSGIEVRSAITIERAAASSVPGPDLFGDAPAETDDLQTRISELIADGAIQFSPDSVSVRGDGGAVIGQVAQLLRQAPAARISIVGHTDSNGDPGHNLDLSARRADAVRDALVEAGVAAGRITTRGAGDQEPLVPNDTPANRRINRRIEITVSGQ